MSASTKIKDIVVIIVVICVIIGIVFRQVSRKKLKTEKNFVIKKTIDEMVTKHNAIADWDKCFVDYEKEIEDGHRGIYTIDIKEALVNNDHRPVLFYGYIADVKKVKETYFTVFYIAENVDITFELKCNSEQIQIILNQPTKDDADYYAVLAIISEIQRPNFEVDSYQSDILVEPCDEYIADGICLDLLFIGDYDY